MPTSVRARLRGARAGGPATPVEYVMLGFAAVVLIALVFFALGRLVDDQMDCDRNAQPAAAASARC
jgi:hypothetical protein